MKRLALIILFALNTSIEAQDLVRYNPIKAEIRGGNDQFEQVLQTQLTLPKNTFLNGYHDNLVAYFLVDSTGHANHITIHSGVYKAPVHAEIKRILKFYSFKRVDPDPQTPYYLNFAVSADKYNGYLKQKIKTTGKTTVMSDSSFVVYGRADKSPRYYKNGEEGLQEFLLSEIEYPKVAIEKSVQGTVILDFVVETNGLITDIVVRQPVGANCTEEAIRLIKKTRWQPAELNKKLVRYKMSYPITFSLRTVTRDSPFTNPMGQ